MSEINRVVLNGVAYVAVTLSPRSRNCRPLCQISSDHCARRREFSCNSHRTDDRYVYWVRETPSTDELED